jgi:EmrB/QacA subfamily drug resistance transporter
MPTETAPGADSQAGAATAPASSRPWRLVLLAVVGAEFMLQLDGTIVNVALPGIEKDLGLGVSGASWVLNGFLLAFGGLLLLAGRLGDVLGHRGVFLAGVGLVGAASLLSGLAPDFPVLLAGRVLQGSGAAIAGPAGLALLTTEFQGERQARAFGLYSTVTGLGAASGMILGGVLTWAGGWRWTLLVNVPVAAVILLLGAKHLTRGERPAGHRSLGVPGAALVTGALAALVYGLVRAAGAGWGDPAALSALGVAVPLFVALPVVDARTAEPLLPRRIFAHRDRLGGFVSLVLVAAVLTGFLFYTIQYLAAVKHFGALRTGLAILPFGLGILVTAQLLGRFLGAVPLKPRGVLGLAVMVGAVLWLSRLGAHSGYAADVLPPITLLGLGVGLAIVPINLTILTTSAPEDTGVTAGVLQAALTVGGTVGLAVLLLPFTGHGGPAATVSSLFDWAAVIAGAGLLVTLAFWFGPGSRSAARPSAPPAPGAATGTADAAGATGTAGR